MYIAFASISSLALEIEALSFAVNRFRKKTKQKYSVMWKTYRAYSIRRKETKQSLTLEKSDGWAALFFCNPVTVVIVLLQLLTIWTR